MREPLLGAWVWTYRFPFNFSDSSLRHSRQCGVWPFRLHYLKRLINRMFLYDTKTCLNLSSSIKMDWILVLLFVFMIESNLEASGIEQILLRNCLKDKLLPIHSSNVTLRLRVMQSILWNITFSFSAWSFVADVSVRLILNRYPTNWRSRSVLNSGPYWIQMTVLILRVLLLPSVAFPKLLLPLCLFALPGVVVASSAASRSLNADLPYIWRGQGKLGDRHLFNSSRVVHLVG